MSKHTVSRRNFLVLTASGITACVAMRRAPAQLSTRSPNEKLNIAGIGAGGKGSGDVHSSATENIVALCDVDDVAAAGTFEKFPSAKRYKDYRKMLDEMKEIDAVNVSTPDHMHFPIAMYAMALGKHVYVQKPMAHTVAETRKLREAARKYGVRTQMGTQAHACDFIREVCEMIWSGAIGEVREVHCWTDRPIWPQGIQDPLPEEPLRSTLDWDLWLGVAPKRPYNPGYCPFNWRGWWDFGTGALGDMGCHVMNAPYWALKLGQKAPTRVELVRQAGMTPQSPPTLSILRYDFPARDAMAPVSMYWYDGFEDPQRAKETQNLPPRPKDIPADAAIGNENNGIIFVGDQGTLATGGYGTKWRLFPHEKFADYRLPDPQIPRIRFGDTAALQESYDFQHHQDWIRAIKGGPVPAADFEYSAPLTEIVLLGNVALRLGQTIDWDGDAMRITNIPEANALLDKEYPAGWLPTV